MARGSAGESALHKHLRVMNAFDARHPFRTLTEISRVTGLPPSTVHRLAAELMGEGLLERMPDRSYRLGVRLWELASRTPGALGLRELARPWLAAVHQRVRQHAVRCALRRRCALHRAHVCAGCGDQRDIDPADAGLCVIERPGCLGLRRREHARGGHRQWHRLMTPYGIETPSALRQWVARVRADGFAVTDGFVHPDSRGIAVPVRGPHGTTLASMSVVVPNDGSPFLPYVEILQWAAAQTTKALQEMYLPLADGEDIHAPLYAGVSTKSLEYFEQLSTRRSFP